jgi:hypothetical protein
MGAGTGRFFESSLGLFAIGKNIPCTHCSEHVSTILGSGVLAWRWRKSFPNPFTLTARIRRYSVKS